jgi:hypothetical protein
MAVIRRVSDARAHSDAHHCENLILARGKQ